MIRRTLAAFLPEFITTVHGNDFNGSLILWDKQTKQSRPFNSSAIPALVQAVQGGMMQHDLYLGMATQPTDLGERKRAGNGSVVQVCVQQRSMSRSFGS